ncbi:stage VI sporulation protein F [Salipaludibacillus keqinensis]|uniref:Stage VI sporulation protein F n=1 Tax=Salipaludibacillus keqinensis TaxID=2045207 RepID=A0A323TL77_9BACI|nr:stage VI sporulation protein F [Salipaludibacillus keqinensis]PYZ94497.1 stage VI sporulation protein F [Salipaludibacillus keqinensis]
MQGKKNPFFDQLEKKTNVKHKDLLQLAQSVNQTDLSNEKNVRQLIHQVALMANVPVSKQKEDELVKAITSNKVPMDFGTLSKMFQKPE